MWILIPIFVVFVAVVLIRTLMFTPEKVENKASYPVFVNGEKATHDLAEMIKCKTISFKWKI